MTNSGKYKKRNTILCYVHIFGIKFKIWTKTLTLNSMAIYIYIKFPLTHPVYCIQILFLKHIISVMFKSNKKMPERNNELDKKCK